MNNKLDRAPKPKLALSRGPSMLSVPRDKRKLTTIDREELVAGWQQSALGILDEIHARRVDGSLTPKEWKELAIAGGVSTEKALLSAGLPTEVIANVHAHRHDLGPLLDRLAVAGKVLDTHRKREAKKLVEADA